MRVPGSQVGSVETRTGETPVRRSSAEAAGQAESIAAHAGEAVVDGSRSREVRTHSERAETARSQKLDRIATKGTIHKNTAARKRSRLTKRLNAARAAKGTKAA